jgi:hypothetical protein
VAVLILRHTGKRRRAFGKLGKAIDLATAYEVLMRASHQGYTHNPIGHNISIQGDAIAEARLTQGRTSSASKHGGGSYSHSLQELVWILISLLLLLYLATSYVFWAKTESAWPIFHGF